MTQATSLAPSTMPLKQGGYTVIEEDVIDWTMSGMLLVGPIPLAFGPEDPAGRARDAAIENSGADALVNVAMDTTVIQLPLGIATLILYVPHIHGDAVKVTE